jgi:hypothetical protein
MLSPNPHLDKFFPSPNDPERWTAFWRAVDYLVRQANLHDPLGEVFELRYLGDHLLPPHPPPDRTRRAAP